MRRTSAFFIAAASGALILAGAANAQMRGGAMGGLGGGMTGPSSLPGQGMPNPTTPGDASATTSDNTQGDVDQNGKKVKPAKHRKDDKANSASQSGADTSATTGAQTQPGPSGSAGATGSATTDPGGATGAQGGANAHTGAGGADTNATAGATGGPH